MSTCLFQLVALVLGSSFLLCFAKVHHPQEQSSTHDLNGNVRGTVAVDNFKQLPFLPRVQTITELPVCIPEPRFDCLLCSLLHPAMTKKDCRRAWNY